MKDTLSFLVQSLLQKNKISVDSEELDFQIQSHPSYPSLHAITGVLSHFNVDNIAIRVSVDKETLEQLPTSLIAQIKRNDNIDFALVLKKEKNYKIISSNKESETISEITFLEQFTGILVAVEKDETKTTNRTNTIRFQKPLFAVSLALFTILFFISSPTLNASIHFILSLIGVAISLLIIQHNLGLSSKIIDNICSQESKTTNCNAVLNSKGATLYKDIKLSDASFIYFVSISITAVLMQLANINYNTLILISSLSIPVVIYSIYHQAFVAKNWCTLCLGILSVLVLQASLLFFDETLDFNMSYLSILLLSLSLLTISSLWLYVNVRLKKEKEFDALKIESTKFKRNFNLFNTLLEQSDTIDTPIPNTSEIILGNTKAPLEIVVITNPFCGHCKDAHNAIESILKNYHNDVKVIVRFNINPKELESNPVKVSNTLLDIYHTKGEVQCLKAMHDIYNNQDAKSWLQKWNTVSEQASNITTLTNESNWCKNNNINFTPELLINGKSFPKEYSRTDLNYFIENLSECCIENQNSNTQSVLQKTI